MVTHTRNLCSAFNPSKCTHTAVSSEQTHTVNTHPEQWAAIYAAAPGEQLGVQCLAQGHLSRGIDGGERERCTFTPPTYNPCQTWDSNPQPLGYKSDSLSFRPRLPQKVAPCGTQTHNTTGYRLRSQWLSRVHHSVDAKEAPKQARPGSYQYVHKWQWSCIYTSHGRQHTIQMILTVLIWWSRCISYLLRIWTCLSSQLQLSKCFDKAYKK